jgi:hypothetical protein
MLGCDTAAVITPDQAKRLADLGYEFIGRYYRRALSGRWTISQEEARSISANGMFLVSVFEGDRAAEKPVYFNAANGAIDGQAALAKARQMRQTTNSAIYFAVDTDITNQTIAGVLEYFDAIEMAFRNQPWSIGVYGDDLVCREVCENDLAAVAWLTNAKGWITDKNFSEWDIKQTSLPMTVMPGLQVDKDEARGFDAAGMWVSV